MFDLKTLFPKKQNTVRVRVERDMIATLGDGTRRDVVEGETIEITESELLKFGPGDLTRLDPSSGPKWANPAPKREDPAPMPESWKTLPACFASWWDLNQKFRVARIHEEQIRNARKALFGSDIDVRQFADSAIVMGVAISHGSQGENPTSIARNLDPRDPETLYRNHCFELAIANAQSHLEELRRVKSLELQRSYLACSDARLANAEELQSVTEGLAETAFSIFHARVAALGIHKDHVRRLFTGSADALKYIEPNTAPSTTGQCILGFEANGQPKIYFDDLVNTTAEILLNEKARLERLKPLLATAKIELARTSKIAG